ncbi:hypothetical protein M1555_00025 [Patescibacteria group bacterium]|nr:hypothetical protein [Patescibacteria group bacterium]
MKPRLPDFSVIIARIFDPFAVYTVTLWLATAKSGIPGDRIRMVFGLLFAISALPLFVLFSAALGTKAVSDWDVSTRSERLPVFAVILAVALGNLLVIRFMGNPFLLRFADVFLLWFLGMFAVTLFWKISGHVAFLTLAVGLLLRWYGTAYWPLLCTVPLLAWARVASHNHTLFQVIAGCCYSGLVIMFFA